VINKRSNDNDAPSTMSQDYLNFNDCDDNSSACHSSPEQEEVNEQLYPGEAFELINPSLKTLLSIFESRNVTRSNVNELK
jgi:hypothetical protein